MKKLRLALLRAALACLALPVASRATDGYAGASFGSSITTNWNQTDAAAKWTTNAGSTYADAVAGTDYHLNGYSVKAGRIGATADQGSLPSTTFVGSSLIIDGYNAASGVTSNTAAGLLHFELTNTAVTAAVGPRASATAYTQASYTANIVAAAPTASEVRTIRGATGVITLNGTLTLNGKTTFNLPSGINDMRFNIEAPVSGTGNIDVSGGSSGGTTSNGYVLWAFRDLTNWKGANINVINKHTIGFTGNADFYTSNPTATFTSVTAAGGSSAGFLNLSGNVSFGSGKVLITQSGTTPTTIANGNYTATQLNAMLTGGSYATQPFATEGAGLNAAGTTFRLYVGQPIPALAPVIVTQPVAKSVFSGVTVMLNVEASANPTPTYQWKKDGNNVGTSSPILTLPSVTSNDAGLYTVVITNTSGTATSSGAQLTVQTASTPPSITTQPAASTNYVGTSATFSVVATGTPVPTYQWQKDGADVVGATASSVTIGNIQTTSAGNYTVIVTNSQGSVTSNPAALTVTPLPVGVEAYANASAGSGDNWISANAAVKWTFDSGADYLAASASNDYHTNGYTVKSGRIGINADTGAAGASTFTGQTLMIDGFNAASGLTDASAAAGGTLTFELASTANGPRADSTKQTQASFTGNIVTAATPTTEIRTIRGGTGVITLDGSLTLGGYTVFNLPGGVNDMYFLIKPQVTGTGSMEFSGGTAGGPTVNGWATWAFQDLSQWHGAKIIIKNKHTVRFLSQTDFYTSNPTAELDMSDTSIGFINLKADLSLGSGKLNLTVGSTKTYTITIPDGPYTVSSLNDKITSMVADLSVSTATTVNNPYATQPFASEGDVNVATANSTGTQYHIYIGSGIPNASTQPAITTQPQSQTVAVGANVTFTAAASGNPVPTFQWKKDGNDISGATNATLILSSVKVTDAGSYTLVASNGIGTAATSTAAVLAVNKATPAITWATPAAITYGTALSGVQLNAASGSVAGTFAYSPASGATPSAGSQTLNVTFTPTDTANYNTATGSTTLTVNKATPTVTWSTPTAITYGTALSGAQLNATSGSVAGTFAYSPASGATPSAGSQTLNVTFTPTDTTNYNSATGSTTLTVNKATPTITWGTPAAITYGTLLSATQLNATSGGVAGTFAYTPASGQKLTAGSQNLSVTFTPTDTANYNPATGGTTITVNKATPVITWVKPVEISHGAALTALQLNATSGGVAGVFTYTPPLGTVLSLGDDQPLSVSFAPTDTVNYNSATGATTITVNNKITPALTWATPTAITYGTALSATQLSATTTDAEGTFTYTPALDTVLNAGTDQTLRVVFTPTDATTYNSAAAEVLITVNQVTPTLTWAAPAAISYGTALTATQLKATANTAGTFTYTPAAGTVLGAGADQTLSVSFTPTDSTNYDATATKTQTITVNKAALTAKATDTSRTFGAPNPSFELTYTGFVNNDTAAAVTAPTASTTATTSSLPGTYVITLTGGSAANYALTLQAGVLTVVPANYAGNYFGTFGSGGYWALSLKADGTGTYIAYLPSRGSAVVVNLTVGVDGTFTVTGTEIKPLAANPVSALALANPEAPLPRTAAAAAGYTLSGSIAFGGTISGQLTGLGETFTGAASAASGPAQTSAGFYTATALGTTPGTTYVIVGASGQTVIVTQSASVVDGATGTVVGGQLTATTAGNATVALTLDSSNQTVSTTVTPAGGGTPITSTGPSSAVTAEARVVNLSVRSQAGTGSDTLIVGMVINGSGNKSLLLRGTGPALLQQNVADALPDPSMRLLDSAGAQIDANDDWGGSQTMINHFNDVGAFAYAGNSKDAALYSQLPAGLYSFHVFPTAGSTASGVVLAELYDADSVQGSATVVNISARTQVGVDDNILILGFVITGNTPKTLLIRGVGPSLVQQGLATGYLVDPQLFLFQGPIYLGMNDDWGGTTALKAAATTVGAGTLSADDSKDAAMLVTLAPGLYSAQVSGVGRTTGVGLVEVFLMP